MFLRSTRESRNMYDVIVVGAGPSGSYAAMRCASMGLDVLLIDQYRFPRDKACGGVVGEEARELLGPEMMTVVERESRGNELYYNYESVGRLQRHEYFCRRRKFDYYLVGRAVNAGAILLDDCKVHGLQVKPDRAIVRTERGSQEGKIVIGADGTNSVIGRSVGLTHHSGDLKYASLKAEIQLPASQIRALGLEDPPRQNTYFFSDLMGFAWLIPNEGQVNAGYGSTLRKAVGLKQRFFRFLNHFGLPPEDVKGAQIPYMTLDKVYSEKVLLTGDAGGFVNPWTGCGIDDGIMASERAAQVCKKAVDAEDFSANSLAEFQMISRSHMRRINWRGSWIKALDYIVPDDYVFPFWVKVLIRRLAALA